MGEHQLDKLGVTGSSPVPPTPEKAYVEPFPDLGSLSDADLKQLIDELTKEEVSDRSLHGRIDLLRAELEARQGKTEGTSVLEDPGP